MPKYLRCILMLPLILQGHCTLLYLFTCILYLFCLCVQTPPAIPTLAVMVFTTILRGSKLIVDYHNYGHTLLALAHGPQHYIVQIARE